MSTIELDAFEAESGISVKVRYANLVNIILDRAVGPELLQDDCRPDRLEPAVARLEGPVASALATASREKSEAQHPRTAAGTSCGSDTSSSAGAVSLCTSRWRSPCRWLRWL